MTRQFAGAILIVLLTAGAAHAQQIHRQDFEGAEPKLRLGAYPGRVRLVDHGLTTETVHSGRQAERMVIQTTSGTYSPVEYPFGQTMLIHELTVSAWVYASKPGTRLLARVVLPRVIDEATKKPMVTVLSGDTYEVSNRWRRMVLTNPDIALQKQQQLLQAERKSTVDIREAYVDMIIFDTFSGLGDLTLIVDDIQIGPLVTPPDKLRAKAPGDAADEIVPVPLRDDDKRRAATAMPTVRNRDDKTRASVVGDRLQVGDRPFFPRGIYRTEAPLSILSDVRFNTVFSPWPVSSESVAEAERLQMHTVPVLPFTDINGAMVPVADRAVDLDFEQKHLFYFVGSKLDEKAEPAIVETLNDIRRKDHHRGRPVTGQVSGNLRRYSKQFDMVTADRFPLMTSLELTSYRQWLMQRKNISRPGAMFMTWIQTQPDEAYSQLVYGHGWNDRFAVPVGPDPAQIRLLTYLSIAAGYRGVVFSSDRALSDATMGRDRALQLGLLNRELALIEPFIAGGEGMIPARTSSKDIGAVVWRHERGSLVLAYWKRPHSQYVLGQASANGVQIVVENAPEAAQAFQIGLGEVRGVKPDRSLGGIRVTIPEFDTVALVVVTSDNGLYRMYQEHVAQIAPLAAAWHKELAEIQLAKTEQTDARLQATGSSHKDASKLIAESRRHLDESRSALDRREYRLTVSEAMRSERLARLVQSEQWKSAVASLNSPVADPFAVSFHTLPESYQFQASLKNAKFGENLLPSGDFEQNGNLDAVGWSYEPEADEGLKRSAMLVGEKPQRGSQSLQLQVAPADADAPPLVVEHTRVAMVSPPIAVRAGQIVRISGYVRVPQKIAGSVDGAMVWDSLGGESLAIRFSSGDEWKKFTLDRPVNRSAELRVHLVLTGLGAVQFDQLSVQTCDGLPLPIAGRTQGPLLR